MTDLPRSGRPRTFTAEQVAEVKALACELPSVSGLPLARWSCPEPAREVTSRRIAEQISASTVRRILARYAIRPWQHRSWILPRDPYFAPKAARVLDLYARIRDGEPLDADDYVLSADEKPGVQARRRICRSLPPTARRAMRVESEYRRDGTLAYFAAYDVHSAHVIGRCEPSTGIAPFSRLTAQVMTAEPYAGARRVFRIVDNGVSHRNWAAPARLADAYPNAHMVYLPVHASWLNQVEVYFSVVQRKALYPLSSPTSARSQTGCSPSDSTTTTPPDRTFTRDDLNQLLHRLGRHDLHAPRPTAT